MNKAQHDQIRKELLSDLRDARQRQDFEEIAACKRALGTLRTIKKVQKIGEAINGK